MALDLTSLTKAINALKASIEVMHSCDNNPETDIALKDTLRSGVIQNFEVAYELCWKFIQRWIRENRVPADADYPITRKELFRMAAKYNLISDPLPWFEFGNARNLTSHTYDGPQAALVYEAAVSFLPYARELLKRLKGRDR